MTMPVGRIQKLSCSKHIFHLSNKQRICLTNRFILLFTQSINISNTYVISCLLLLISIDKLIGINWHYRHNCSPSWLRLWWAVGAGVRAEGSWSEGGSSAGQSESPLGQYWPLRSPQPRQTSVGSDDHLADAAWPPTGATAQGDNSRRRHHEVTGSSSPKNGSTSKNCRNFFFALFHLPCQIIIPHPWTDELYVEYIFLFFVHLFIYSFIHSFLHSLSFVHSSTFIHSFIH